MTAVTNQKDNVALALVLTLCAYCMHVTGDTLLKVMSDNGAFNAMSFIFLFTSLCCTFGYTVATGRTRVLYKVRMKPVLLRGSLAAVATMASLHNIANLPLGQIYSLGFIIPAIAVWLAWVILKEKPSITAMLAIGFGILGAVVIFQPGAALGLENTAVIILRTVAAAACVVTTRFCKTDNPFAISIYTLLFVSMGIFPLAYDEFALLTQQQVITCIGIGIMSAIASQASIRAVQWAPVNATAPANYFKFLLGLGVGYVVWNEVPSHDMIVGVGFVMVSSILVTTQLYVEPMLKRLVAGVAFALSAKQTSAVPVRHSDRQTRTNY